MNLLEDGTAKSSPLKLIGGILYRRKWQIVLTFLPIVLIVTVMTLRATKIYSSRMKILVKNERAGIVVSASSSDQSLNRGEVSETQINTEIELLNNNDLLRQVVIASGLNKVDEKHRTKLDTPEVVLENAVLSLQRDLRISPVRKADIIEVEYTSTSPKEAAAVLRQLASSYLEAHLRLHGTPGTHEFFLNQTAHYHKELEEAEGKLTDFRLRNGILLFGQQQEEIVRRASESSSMLLAADAGIHEVAQRVADSEKRLASIEPRVVTQRHTLSNQNSVERLSTTLVDLQNRRTQLLAKFRPEDRLVQEVSQEISDTSTALEKAKDLTSSDLTSDVNPIHQSLTLEIEKERAELAGLQAKRDALQQQTRAYQTQSKLFGKSTEEYNDLIRRQKEAEDKYLLYARKTEEARIADSLDQQKIANVVLAENPIEPHHPSKPNVQMNLELGTVFAVLASLGVAFGMEYLKQPFPPEVSLDSVATLGASKQSQVFLETIDKPSDLEVLTGLPVLAVTKRS